MASTGNTDATRTGFADLRGRQFTDITPTIDRAQIKVEPTSDGDEDDDDCRLVAYPPLQHGEIKVEELEDGHDETHSEIQGGDHNVVNKLADNASSVAPFIVTSASDDGNVTKQPRANKRKRNPKSIALSIGTTSTTGFGHVESKTSAEMIPSSTRALRCRSKGSSSLMAVRGGVTRGKPMETELDESRSGGKEQNKAANYDETSEVNQQSSLEDHSSSSDNEGQVSSGPSQSSKQKVVGKTKTKVHEIEEKNDKPYKCPNCGTCFKMKNYLKKHLARTCGVEAQFPCKECGHQFKQKYNLRQHLVTKHNVKKSQMAIFGAGPAVRPVFPVHRCEKCEKTFKLKTSLVNHLKFECEVEPSFPCTLCNYRAKQKGNLRSHLISVHNLNRSQFDSFGAAAQDVRPERAFKCGKCERSYKHKKHLNRHLKYECGLDPSFSCDQCDYRAAHKSGIKTHIINVHAGATVSHLEA